MARVTVVNDQPEFLGVMRDVLDELGHEALALEGSTVTVDQIADGRPELLIVDLRLKNEVLNDGWGLIVAARAHPALRDIPIVISTGDHEFLNRRAEEISALADVHPLPKPFAMEDVEELLARLLERAQSAEAR
jgi:CheY-like chemotaxis protein